MPGLASARNAENRGGRQGAIILIALFALALFGLFCWLWASLSMLHELVHDLGHTPVVLSTLGAAFSAYTSLPLILSLGTTLLLVELLLFGALLREPTEKLIGRFLDFVGICTLALIALTTCLWSLDLWYHDLLSFNGICMLTLLACELLYLTALVLLRRTGRPLFAYAMLVVPCLGLATVIGRTGYWWHLDQRYSDMLAATYPSIGKLTALLGLLLLLIPAAHWAAGRISDAKKPSLLALLSTLFKSMLVLTLLGYNSPIHHMCWHSEYLPTQKVVETVVLVGIIIVGLAIAAWNIVRYLRRQNPPNSAS